METKNNHEHQIMILGFGLIFFVIVLTLVRGTFFSNSKNQDLNANIQSGKTENSLPYKTINANDLNKKILSVGEKKELFLLDIRPFDEYIREHITDSINIPPEDFPIGSKIDIHSHIIIIASNSLDKSIVDVVEKLKQENYEDFLVLAGGMENWKNLIGSTVTYGDPNSFVDQSKVSYLDPEKLDEAITKNVPVYIVDVRSSENFNNGHISGAINIPFEDLEKRRFDIKEKKIVVVGDNELQEFQASVQMYDMLLASPFVMRTAMPGWQNKKFPLVQ